MKDIGLYSDFNSNISRYIIRKDKVCFDEDIMIINRNLLLRFLSI